ncbi:hypothetical protein P3T23_009478 [Paraburkholderia sp. GAS448]|uniref:hypothetical protein n=1 Tax=Paraburkholderia sp. GAS448 TaxID=3035136 RepID=UPI003D1B792D
MLNNALNNVLKFAATAAQETSSIFDNAPVESMTEPASGLFETCTDWVSENKTAVIGAAAVVAVGLGAYYSYPLLRDRFSSRNGTTESKQATPETNSAPPTAEQVQAELERATQAAQDFMKNKPAAGNN